jgi:hypothetical protein
MKNNQLTKIKKIKIYLSNLWFSYIKKPFYYDLIVEPRIKKEHAIKIAKLKKEFEQKQKTSIQRIKEVMFHEKVYFENNPKFNYLNQKLVEGRENVNKMSKYVAKTPFFYEPEICDVHNENIKLTNKNIHRLITYEKNLAWHSLKNQEKKVGGTTDTIPNLYKKTFTDTLKKDEDFLDTVNNIEVRLKQLRQWDSEEEKLKHENLIKNLNSVLKK